MNSGSFDSWTPLAIVGLFVAIAIAIAAIQPAMEARAFNKFTSGPKATYWDAVFTQLRVMNASKGE